MALRLSLALLCLAAVHAAGGTWAVLLMGYHGPRNEKIRSSSPLTSESEFKHRQDTSAHLGIFGIVGWHGGKQLSLLAW